MKPKDFERGLVLKARGVMRQVLTDNTPNS